MDFLRQSTAVVISLGPFVDKTDAVTLEIGLVSALDHVSTGIKLSKAGGALTVRTAAVTASTYDSYGNYLVTLSATDTNTRGILRVQYVDPTTNLAVFKDFLVIAANAYDALVNGIYWVKVDLEFDDTSAQDEYTVGFVSDGSDVATADVTTPTITVILRSDGSTIINAVALTAIAGTKKFKYDATTTATRLPAGDTAIIQINGVIGGTQRGPLEVIRKRDRA